MNNKNRTALVLGFTLISSIAFSQKAAVVSAYNYNKSYERDKDCSELEKGIEAIKPATKNAKTGSYAKTWYYGGNLYFNAVISTDEACKAKFTDAVERSYEFYTNAMKFNIEDASAAAIDINTEEGRAKLKSFIDNKSTKYGDQSYQFQILKNRYPFIANAFINEGVAEFNKKNYEKALNFYDKSVEINGMLGKFDSLGLFNGAIAAESAGMFDEAIIKYTKLTEVDYGGADTYIYLSNVYNKKKDSANRVNTIESALVKYPTNSDLLIEQLNYLLKSGQSEKAMESFDMAISGMPENASLYYNRGFVYERNLKDMEKAAVDYQKAFELDPTFFDAIYSLGAMYYNTGVEWNNKASNYGLSETDKFEEAKKKSDEYFSKAIPALEKAHGLDPDDLETIGSLVSVYSRTGAEVKYNEMKAKLEAAKAK